MNDLETSYFVQQYPTLVAIFVIMVLVIAVLSGVVFVQLRNKQIQPKYGFLGKPLAVMFFLVVAAGSISLVYYSTKNAQDVDTVSADRELNLKISETLVSNNIYRFNVTPSINNDLWGSGEKFNAYWTISNSESYTRVELDLTEQNVGGVTIELKPGNNIVKVVVFSGGLSKEASKEINI